MGIMLWWTLWQLKSRNPKTRARALWKLSKIKDSRAVEHLIAALRDRHWLVRKTAVEALGTMEDARVVDTLAELLMDGKADVRQATINVLERFGDKRGRKRLIQDLGDEAFGIRFEAAKSLAEFGDTRAVRVLIQGLKRDCNHQQRAEAVMALAKLGDAATRSLVAALEREDIVLDAAMMALKPIVNAQSARSLLAIIEREELRVYKCSENTYYYFTKDKIEKAAELIKTVMGLLQQIFENDAKSISEETLRAIAGRSMVNIRYELSCSVPGSLQRRSEKIDCSVIKQLARQELSCRGLET
jgi:HEAT repeat protein